MEQPKVLYSSKWYDLVDINSHVGLISKHMTVGVLPFTTNENGLIEKIGLIKEHNNFREGSYCDTLITGTVEYEDDSLLFTAKRELLEESGIEMTSEDNDKWIFLGTVYLLKDCDKVIPIFGVNVTGKGINKPEGDGSDKEKLAEFFLKPVGEGLASDESLVLAAFLRLFNYMYAKAVNYVQS